MKRGTPTPGILLALLVLGAIGLAACGGSDAPDPAATKAAASAQRTGQELDVSPPLAENLEQANEIIDGGTEALEAKLADLQGIATVVNQWGSWCPPCRAEFPFFAESAKRHLDEIAFIGVDIQDDRDAAEDFLEALPTPYPHIFDQDNAAVSALGWTGVSPTTWLIDEHGEIVHQRPGAYASRDELEADIQRFLLQG